MPIYALCSQAQTFNQLTQNYNYRIALETTASRKPLLSKLNFNGMWLSGDLSFQVSGGKKLDISRGSGMPPNTWDEPRPNKNRTQGLYFQKYNVSTFIEHWCSFMGFMPHMNYILHVKE